MSKQNFKNKQEGLPSVALLARRNFSEGEAQEGSVIIFTILILGSMLTITLALASIYLPKLRTVGDAGAGSVGAIYAADSALEWCLYTNRGNPALPMPIMSNGATYTLITGGAPAVDCTSSPLNEQAVGTYRGVSRSLQVTTP